MKRIDFIADYKQVTYTGVLYHLNTQQSIQQNGSILVVKLNHVWKQHSEKNA